MLPGQTAVWCELCRSFEGFDRVAMIPFLLIGQSKVFLHRFIIRRQTYPFSEIGYSRINLSGCDQTITQLRLHQIISRRQARGTLQWWNCLLDAVQVDIAIAHHRKHESAVWRYLNRLHDGAQRSFGMPERVLRACQLDPG